MVAKGFLLKLKWLLRIFSNEIDVFSFIYLFKYIFYIGFKVNCKGNNLKSSSENIFQMQQNIHEIAKLCNSVANITN